MRILLALAPLLIAAAPADRAEAWWRHVEVLAADDMEGRAAGSEGHRRASDYVAARFAEYGLEPAGDGGTFFQAVTLEERTVVAARSRVDIVTRYDRGRLNIPADIVFRVTSGPPPETVDDAPMVFVGFGLHLPEAGHDDLAGLDLRGKVAVFLEGDPAHLPEALKSHARADRARALAARGAVGMIQIVGAVGTSWDELARSLSRPGAYPADPAARWVAAPFFSAYVGPRPGGRLFIGIPQRLRALINLAINRQTRQLPRFPFAWRLRASIATERRQVVTRNVIGRLPGSDPQLAAELVVLTAHLDHLGLGRPVDGDAIYNGALDNAAGVGTLLDIAEELRRQRARPRRSLMFVALTAEELGLLGSRWLVAQPVEGEIVANLNYDMALPLFPLTGVTVLGTEESSLGPDARAVGAAMGLPVLPDPFPERNSFIRSDQYSFIEAGIPALAFKFGFRPGTPEAEIERAWRARIYHSPQDDVSQTVYRADEIRLHDFIAAIALRVANADARPRWNGDSFFRRFARD